MPPQQIDPVLAAEFSLRRFHAKGHAVLVQANRTRPPVVFFTESDPHDRRARAPDDLLRPFVVAIDKELSVRRQQFREPAFFLRHARQVAKKFQMLAADVRQHAVFRLNHFHQRREFARMIRARFEHRRPVRFFQAQQRQRHADVVVETRLAPKRGQRWPQRRRDQFLGRRLAVGAADGDHRQIKFPPVRRGEFSQRRARVIHDEHRAVRQWRGNFFCSTTTAATPLAATSFKKSWPSKRSPLMAKNKSPGFACRESVQTRCDRRSARSAPDFRRAGFSHKFQRTCFHCQWFPVGSRIPRARRCPGAARRHERR